MAKDLKIGVDVGAITVKVVLLNSSGIIKKYYIRHKGSPVSALFTILNEIFSNVPFHLISAFGITGTGGKEIAQLLGCDFVNEVVAHVKAVELLHPEVKTIIEIGGTASKLITFEDGRITDISMNSICAAGAGSFFDEQAQRLELSIEEFGEISLRSKKPPRIAGRCSVFAKSDMIHLQQEGTPVYDIVNGLCFAFVRNLKSSLIKGKILRKPISFQGGVAANKGIIRALKEVLELKENELIIPSDFALMGAIGASNCAKKADSLKDIDILKDFSSDGKHVLLSPLTLEKSVCHYLVDADRIKYISNLNKKIDAYIGVDVGSVSTNVVAIDKDKNLLARRYLPTAGRPIEAVRRGIKEIEEEIGEFINVCGVATTGSGRYMIGDLIGADIVINEITAQARAAVEIDPTVDTIFEIGGQDSKFISLSEGRVVDFEMNKVCAAGTGSFLEEQASLLGLNIKEEFSKNAFLSSHPVKLGERCTTFIQSDLVKYQNKGLPKEDIVAGLAYSIVYNYLNRVVGSKKIGNNIFFQGGVAANKSVVAAFEKVLGKKITVPPHHDVTGAIGASLIALEEVKERSKFKGFSVSKKEYNIYSFECNGCANRCEIKKVEFKDDKPLFYGSRCEKYEIPRGDKGKNLPDLFTEREKFLLNTYNKEIKGDKTIGIPYSLTTFELYPFWKAFFSELNFNVVLSDRTNKEIVNDGIESVLSETCFPIKVTHGHVLNLMKKGVDYVFLPSIVNWRQNNLDEFTESFSCPFTQTIPYIIKSALKDVKVLTLPVIFGFDDKYLEDSLYKLLRQFKRSKKEISRALNFAKMVQDEFYNSMRKRGEEILKNLPERGLVLVSRTYNGCDRVLNLDLPTKFKNLGEILIPMDFLPLNNINISNEWKNMYWRSGQKILSVCEFINNNTKLYAVYLTNFGCGPDSFITHFFDKKSTKPYLVLEIDEHSADAGIITRCEAFLDSLKNSKYVKKIDRFRTLSIQKKTKRKIYIPNMCDHAFVLGAAFNSNGVDAEVLPESDELTLELGRKYTNGRECYPAILTTGDIVKKVLSKDFKRDYSAFFMPSSSGPCRFGSYNYLHRIILDRLGFSDVPIYSPNQGNKFYNDIGIIGNKFVKQAFDGIVAVDILDKCAREIRPYEINPGETDRVYKKYLDSLCKAIKNNEDLLKIMKMAKEEFKDIKVKKENKPIVGIVGEIYIRSNRFANENLIRELESLGVECWMPPQTEWLFYVNYCEIQRNWQRKYYSSFIKSFIIKYIQEKSEHRISCLFDDFLRNCHEPPISEIVQYGSNYIHPTFQGEAILSVGKAKDFVNKRVSGIISVMPFTCMPGTVVDSISKSFIEDNNNIPWLNIAYDGSNLLSIKTRIEAFVYQVKEFEEQRGNI